MLHFSARDALYVASCRFNYTKGKPICQAKSHEEASDNGHASFGWIFRPRFLGSRPADRSPGASILPDPCMHFGSVLQLQIDFGNHSCRRPLPWGGSDSPPAPPPLAMSLKIAITAQKKPLQASFFSKNKKSYQKIKKALDFSKAKCYNILGFRSKHRKNRKIWVWRSW